ncbi:MAG: zinc ribbon domain-containing protein [Deltaproteobacteria bacterium]|nr:zinc ribbon domain-containing protein [Deltaproteobacteria bacterium]
MPATRPPDSMTPLEAVIPSQIPSQLVMLSQGALAGRERPTTVCSTCRAEVPAGRFCEQCGCSLAPAKSFCDQCGAKLRPEAKFCTQCAAPTR